MFSLLFGRYLRAESLCHIVCLCFMFLKILPDCFPKWLSYFTVILTMQESSHCSKSAPTLTVCHADHSHISEWEMVSHHGFDLYFFNWFVFLMTNDVMHHYICLLASYYIYISRRNMYSNSWSIFQLSSLLLLTCKSSFLYSGYKSLSENMVWEYFFQSIGCLVTFLTVSFEAWCLNLKFNLSIVFLSILVIVLSYLSFL